MTLIVYGLAVAPRCHLGTRGGRVRFRSSEYHETITHPILHQAINVATSFLIRGGAAVSESCRSVAHTARKNLLNADFA